MISPEELREQTNKARVNLLFSDAEMALTMIDLARVSQNAGLKQKRIDQAAKAYSFIRERIPTVSLTPPETIRLNDRMKLLKLRLALSS